MENEIIKLYLEYGMEDTEISKELGIKKWRVHKITKELHRNKEQINNKRIKTNLEKYGVSNISQTEDIKDKKTKTCLTNYGVEKPCQNNEIKDKMLNTKQEKYNGNGYSSEVIKDKIINSLQEKYNTDNVMKNKEIAEKTSKTLKANQSEYIQNNRKKYGVDYPSQLKSIIDKVNNTKRINKTFNVSKEEDDVYDLIIELFPKSIRQYKNELYPFACDFYIPDLNLYIECNFSWTHGGMPYVNNEECNVKLDIWKEKSKTSKYYSNAINTWTIRDVNKRNWANDHKLCWLEFFNLDEFLKWYEDILCILNK